MNRNKWQGWLDKPIDRNVDPLGYEIQRSNAQLAARRQSYNPLTGYTIGISEQPAMEARARENAAKTLSPEPSPDPVVAQVQNYLREQQRRRSVWQPPPAQSTHAANDESAGMLNYMPALMKLLGG
jgi:hypothetical protein